MMVKASVVADVEMGTGWAVAVRAAMAAMAEEHTAGAYRIPA